MTAAFLKHRSIIILAAGLAITVASLPSTRAASHLAAQQAAPTIHKPRRPRTPQSRALRWAACTQNVARCGAPAIAGSRRLSLPDRNRLSHRSSPDRDMRPRRAVPLRC
jgi:hypothetical protein